MPAGLFLELRRQAPRYLPPSPSFAFPNAAPHDQRQGNLADLSSVLLWNNRVAAGGADAEKDGSGKLKKRGLSPVACWEGERRCWWDGRKFSRCYQLKALAPFIGKWRVVVFFSPLRSSFFLQLFVFSFSVLSEISRPLLWSCTLARFCLHPFLFRGHWFVQSPISLASRGRS